MDVECVDPSFEFLSRRIVSGAWKGSYHDEAAPQKRSAHDETVATPVARNALAPSPCSCCHPRGGRLCETASHHQCRHGYLRRAYRLSTVAGGGGFPRGGNMPVLEHEIVGSVMGTN